MYTEFKTSTIKDKNGKERLVLVEKVVRDETGVNWDEQSKIFNENLDEILEIHTQGVNETAPNEKRHHSFFNITCYDDFFSVESVYKEEAIAGISGILKSTINLAVYDYHGKVLATKNNTYGRKYTEENLKTLIDEKSRNKNR